MIREIAGSSLYEHVCDGEREIPPHFRHKRHVNVKLFQAKSICNIDSSSPGAELNGKFWPLGSSLVSDEVKTEKTNPLLAVHQHGLSYQKSCFHKTV